MWFLLHSLATILHPAISILANHHFRSGHSIEKTQFLNKLKQKNLFHIKFFLHTISATSASFHIRVDNPALLYSAFD